MRFIFDFIKITVMNKSIKFLFLSGCALLFLSCGNNKSEAPKEESLAPAATEVTAEPTVANAEHGVGLFAGKDVPAFDAATVTTGNEVFDQKCKACHMTTDQKVVGPGLLSVTKRRTPQWILNMIVNPVEMTEKDPVAKQLLEEHKTQMAKMDISDEDALAVLNYLRSVDGEK